ncbi:MAG: hypothetical protein FWF38_02065 [Spirochaetaceae bacterium]|nr:hypothetical protein [Spirochaetaceae bacterium]
MGNNSNTSIYLYNILLTSYFHKGFNNYQSHATGHEQGRVVGREEGKKYFLELLDQGLSIDEIKKRLNQNNIKTQDENKIFP